MKKNNGSLAIWISLGYLVIGMLWFLFFDRLLDTLFKNGDVIRVLQFYKEWAFVILSALVVFVLLSRRGKFHLPGANGQHEGALATANDMVENKQVEGGTLYRSEQLLRLFVEHTPAAVAMLDRDMRYIVVSHRYLTDYGLDDQDLVGRSHYDVFPEIPEHWKEIHRRCLAGAVEKADEDPFPRADGRLDWVQWEIRPWFGANREIGGIILFSEVVTRRKQAEEILQKRYKELTAVYEASQRLQKLLAPDQLAQEIIEVLEHTLDYTYSAVLLADRSHGIFEPFAISDQKKGGAFIQADKDYIRSKGARLGKGVTGWVFEHGESLCLGDVQSDPRYLSMREDIHSELCVPLRVHDQVIGVVNVESTQPDAYNKEDQQLLETVTTQIAIAIQNSRLIEELRLNGDRLSDLSRRLVDAYETERRTIGRELHDQFGQMLTAIKITLDMSRQLPPDAVEKKITQAQEIVADLLRRVSRLSLELRPSTLDDLGLISALTWHVNHYQEQTGIQVEFSHNGLDDRRFATEIETTGYRVVQEALTNVARHANAAQVRLDVRADGDWLEIRIEDDGVGFHPDKELAKKRGLTGMRERAQLVDGTFEILSEPGSGARMFIRLPLRDESS